MTWTNKLYNILLLNSLSGGMIYGILFVRTRFIYWTQCVIGAIWIVGVLLETYLYVREYRKFLKILKGNIPCLELEEKKNRIQKELAIKQKIKIYQNYAIDSPIVKGIFVANQNSREISVEGKFKIL